MSNDLLRCRRNVFSQNGEDGVLEALFDLLPPTPKICCEFGAHDGVTFSNTRRLALQGWRSVMIEADAARFAKLEKAFPSGSEVYCINARIDADENSLEMVLDRAGLSTMSRQLGFLSVDIDGLDYEILESLTLRPCVICIEVNGAHRPAVRVRVAREVAARNVGQPLAVMTEIASEKGYELVCFTSNAIFVRGDLLAGGSIRPLTPTEAYEEYLESLERSDRDWLFLENLALVEPFYHFANPCLSRESLGLGVGRAAWLRVLSLRYRATAWWRDLRGAAHFGRG